MSPFWAGFWSVWMYAGAYLTLAPFWMKDWDSGIKNLLEIRT